MNTNPKKSQPRPLDAQSAPDTARVYERAKPEAESGMGRLDIDKAMPAQRSDKMSDAVSNKQGPRQINADETVHATGGKPPQSGREVDRRAAHSTNKPTGRTAAGKTTAARSPGKKGRA
jgi:hypothetical protein